MRVFEYWGSQEHFARFDTQREWQSLWSDQFHGESNLTGWPSIHLHPEEEERGKPLPLGPIADVTTVNSVVKNCVWSPRARRALEPHVAHCGEFLPLGCDEAEWVLFNVTRVIDALDEAASEVIYYDEQRKSGRFVRMVFKPEALAGEIIFRIPQRSSSDIFVTDAFVRLIEAHGLVGFELKPMWSDEDPASA